ncbi:MAG TPA: hypothetical protein PKC30_13090 [Saprospiraceae bacterium]|nr:hypothetical protein [Saprospiraceae bacterium]
MLKYLYLIKLPKKASIFCKLYICIFCYASCFQIGKAQAIKAFYIGHSLSDQIPDMTKSLSDNHSGVMMDWVYQSIPGAPLRWQWDRKDQQDYGENLPYFAGFYNSNHGLPSGDFDVLVLTESVPRHVTPWGIFETYQYVDSFYHYFIQFNPGKQIYLYEVWHCLQSGTPNGCSYDIDSSPWRQRLDDDLAMWESVLDTINCRLQPEIPIRMIPGAQALARLHDSIQEGAIPGIHQISDLFTDDIHLSDQGKYFIACVHFSVLYGISPEGLTHQTQVWWGGNFDPPTPIQALKFQQIAWQTVTDLYRLTGVFPDGKHSDRMVWKGIRSDSASNPCNWDNVHTPTIENTVIVPGQTPHGLTIDNHLTIKALHALPQAHIILPAGIILEIDP